MTIPPSSSSSLSFLHPLPPSRSSLLPPPASFSLLAPRSSLLQLPDHSSLQFSTLYCCLPPPPTLSLPHWYPPLCLSHASSTGLCLLAGLRLAPHSWIGLARGDGPVLCCGFCRAGGRELEEMRLTMTRRSGASRSDHGH
eukprot:750869-Hanusia_phi.AAC.2